MIMSVVKKIFLTRGPNRRTCLILGYVMTEGKDAAEAEIMVKSNKTTLK